MKTKNITKITLSVLLLLSACILSGCQLAQKDDLTVHKSERLCGIFVTIGLDTSKFYEEQLKNAQFKVNNQGDLEIQTIDPASREVEGTMTGDGRINFGAYQGYYMGEGEVIVSNGDKLPTNFADPGFYDVKCSINEKDDGKDSSFEGSIAISRNSDKIIHMNPVYQREDGSIYTILGQSMGYSSSGNASGMVLSQTFSNTTTTSGSSRHIKKENTSFKINITMVDEAKQIIVKEMNSKDELIKATEYYPDSPDEYVVDSKTCYILVEERNDNKTDNITRYVYNLEGVDPKDYYVGHNCHFAGDDAIIGVKHIRFINAEGLKYGIIN